jgi:hypothetical protein
MPRWIPGPDGNPVYTDDSGAPVSPMNFQAPTGGLSDEALVALSQYSGGEVQPITPEAPGSLAGEGDPWPAPPPAQDPTAPASTPTSLPAPEAAPAPAPAGAPVTSVGSSLSAFSTPKYNEVARTSGGVEGLVAQNAANAKAHGQGLATAAAAASDEQKQAVLAESGIQADRLTAQSQQNLVLAHLNDSFARVEQEEYQKARAASADSRARYESMLAEIRGTQLDPSAIFKGPGGTGFSVGSIASAFAQGYLGAKGIKITAIEALNHAIDRNMDAQIANLRNKQQVASGFKDLWDMQRAESASDAEARQRVRGFILQSTKDAVAAELGKYDSDLARAKGSEAVAAIDQELVKNLTGLYQTMDANAMQAAQQQISIWGTKVNAALTREGHNIEREKLAQSKKAGKDQARELAVRDRDGNVVGFANTKEQATALQNQIVGASNTSSKMIQLQDMMREVGPKYSGKGAKAFDDKDSAALRSLWTDLIGDIVKAKTGAQATDAERAKYEKILPFEDLSLGLLKGANPAEYVSARFGVRSIDDLRTAAKAQLAPPTPEQSELYRGGAGGDLLSTERASQGIIADKRDRPTDSPSAKLAAEVTGPEAKHDVIGDHGEDRERGKALHDEATAAGILLNEGKTGGDRLAEWEAPGWFDRMSRLGDLAAGGDQGAVNQLHRLSQLPDKTQAASASYFLLKASEAPAPPQQQDTGLTDEQLLRFQGSFAR